MKPVSDLLSAAVAATAIFALTPHRGIANHVVVPANVETAYEVRVADDTSPAPNVGASAQPTGVSTPSPAPSPAAIVDTKDYAYAPDPVTIAVGQTVLFKNSDAVAHTIAAADGSFDSGNMPHGATWSHTFAKAGTYAYYCDYHRYMQGKVIVK